MKIWRPALERVNHCIFGSSVYVCICIYLHGHFDSVCLASMYYYVCRCAHCVLDVPICVALCSHVLHCVTMYLAMCSRSVAIVYVYY
jgi:hypothetical protein